MLAACGVVIGCGESGGQSSTDGETNPVSGAESAQADAGSAADEASPMAFGDRSASGGVSGEAGERTEGSGAATTADDEADLSPLERLRRASAAKAARDEAEIVRRSQLRQLENIAVRTSTGDPGSLVMEGRDDMADAVNALMEFETAAVDLGRLMNDDPVDVEFEFVNRGTDPLVISDVRASCGCTALNKESIVGREFGAGESGVIAARYTPPNAGRSTKYVTVTSNDRRGQPIRLELSAEYLPPAKLSRSRVALGMASVSDPHTAETFISMRESGAEIVGVEFAEGGIFGWSAEPVDSPDVEYEQRQKITFSAVDRPKTGPFHERATISVRHPGEDGAAETHEMVFTLIGSLISSLKIEDSPTAQYIRIPTVSSGERFSYEQVLMHEQGESFAIEDITFETSSGPVSELTATAEPIEGSNGTRHLVVIEGVAGAVDRARFGGQLVITTDLENEGPLTLRVSGAMRDDSQANAQ